MQNKDYYTVQDHSSSPILVKLICDFLLVINTNLHPIAHRFEVIVYI